ncbi:AI-2E family transporter [Zobellia amurskyensis]|uniref:AI-2E family transporter n=1 Tax=Zobellia amurskyensis TaxID=248905 RepID=A0A7X2ZSH0_9FLAO|nr:AI-2E family transporter [Zobellia amurskyensis]MUH35558.1 AI-2E family transporter [Zobellia amurskyensis]
MNSIHPKVIRQLFVLLLIVLIGGLIFREMAPYFSGVLGAITLYVLLKKPMSKLINRGWKPNLAVSLLMFASVIIILIPVSGAVLMLGNKISEAVKNSEKVTKAVKEQLQSVESYVGYDLSSEIDVSAVSGWLSNSLQGFAGSTFTSVIAIGIMYFFLYFMLTNRKELRESLFEYIPIGTDNLKTIGSKIRQMVRANALGIPLVAIAQGVVALIGFLIFGIQNPFFWAAIVAIGSMIPFVGNMLGTLPVFVLTLSAGDTFQAWGILIYGIVVVGSTDNIIRLYILRKLDDVHPLITLIGVLIGIPLFGFIGLIFGPLFVSLFLIIVQIYKQEYGKQDNHNL